MEERGRRKKLKRRLRVAVALELVTVVLSASVAGASAGQQTGNVYDLQQGLTEVSSASANLVRGSNDLTFTVNTTGLHGGNAYTVWWIVFNNPQYCSNPLLPGIECGFGDLYFPEFGLDGDPRVEATILYATGHVVGRNGRAGFASHLRVGDGEPIIGSGLSNPGGAEVILDLMDHGAKDPGNVPNQIHEFVTAEDSCNPSCADHQLVGFGI